MATLIFSDAFVSINAVDLSDHVKSVSIDYSADMQDDTAMGLDTKSNKPGLKDWSMSVEFHQDFATSNVDATLFGLVGSTFAVIVRPVKSVVVGTTNPNYTATGALESYNPIGGSVGDLAGVSASIKPAGQANATLVRATS